MNKRTRKNTAPVETKVPEAIEPLPSTDPETTAPEAPKPEVGPTVIRRKAAARSGRRRSKRPAAQSVTMPPGSAVRRRIPLSSNIKG